jgi:hypothetical protein
MAGTSVSMFGSRISTIAFPMLVLHLSGSPFTAGLVLFAAVVPSMLVYIPAGAVVDRCDPKRVMLVSEVGRGIAIGFVVVKLALGRPSVSVLILAMVAEEILEIFSTLADRRYINCLAEREDTSKSQAYIEVRTHSVVLAGRPIGPFLFSVRPIVPFLADAVSFAVSVASLIYIRGTDAVARRPRERLSARQLRSDVRDGIRWLHNNKYARIAVALMACTTLIAQALLMIFLSEAHTQQLSSVTIGLVLAASGGGGVLGSVVAGRLPESVRIFWLQIQMCAWCVALAFLAVSGGRSVLWIGAAMIVLGFTGAIGNVELGTYLVKNAGDGMLSRVTSIGSVLAIGACALGPMVGGTAIQNYGIQGAVSALSIMVVALAATSFCVPGFRAEIFARFLEPASAHLLMREEVLILARVAVDACGDALPWRRRTVPPLARPVPSWTS